MRTVNPHDPAFPISNDSDKEYYWIEKGLPIRLELASRAMSSILANPVVNPLEIGDKQITEIAFFFADALILKYNASQS